MCNPPQLHFPQLKENRLRPAREGGTTEAENTRKTAGSLLPLPKMKAVGWRL